MMSEDTYEDVLSVIDDVDSQKANEEKEMFPGFQGFLFTPQELERRASRGLMRCQCIQCGRIFSIPKNQIQARIKANRTICCCSRTCTMQYKRECKKSSRQTYHCATCGKYVSLDEYYGSGRFCCQKCSNAYSSKFGNTPEKRKQKSEKLSKGIQKHVLKPCEQCGKMVEVSINKKHIICNNCKSILESKCKVNCKSVPESKRKVKKYIPEETYNNLYNQIKNLYDVYNFNEMQSYLHIDETTFNNVIKQYHIKPNPIFIPINCTAKIRFSKLILNKTESITYNDFNKVKSILEHHYYDEMMSSVEIKELYHIEYSGFGMCLKKVFGITLRNLSESNINYHQKIGTYDNKTEKELYYMQCDFKFGKEVYPRLPGFELVKQYGWYKPSKNRFFGATRDHMVSRHYGWTHNIDPKIIRHPANCQIMLSTDNASKREKCSITLEELLERIEHWK